MPYKTTMLYIESVMNSHVSLGRIAFSNSCAHTDAEGPHRWLELWPGVLRRPRGSVLRRALGTSVFNHGLVSVVNMLLRAWDEQSCYIYIYIHMHMHTYINVLIAAANNIHRASYGARGLGVGFLLWNLRRFRAVHTVQAILCFTVWGFKAGAPTYLVEGRGLRPLTPSKEPWAGFPILIWYIPTLWRQRLEVTLSSNSPRLYLYMGLHQ